MLTEAERAELRARFHPDYSRLVFAPVDEALERHVKPDALVLDAGAGMGTWVLRRHRATTRLCVGLDLCRPAGWAGGAFIEGDVTRLPFAPGVLDLVVCYNVVEHLADPCAAFSEFTRVLSPGGWLIVKTPNLRSPLIAAARLVSIGVRRRLKRRLGDAEAAVFPAFYRCNSASELHEALTGAGFSREVLVGVDQTCEYLAFSRLTFAAGLLYSRLMQARSGGRWRSSLVAVYQKQQATTVSSLQA